MEHTVSVDGTSVSINETTTVAELKCEVGYGDSIIAMCKDGDNCLGLANRDRILECVSPKEDIQINLRKPPGEDSWVMHDELEE